MAKRFRRRKHSALSRATGRRMARRVSIILLAATISIGDTYWTQAPESANRKLFDGSMKDGDSGTRGSSKNITSTSRSSKGRGTSLEAAKERKGSNPTASEDAAIAGADLWRIIQELEESDYGSYGSWGNFEQPTTVPHATTSTATTTITQTVSSTQTQTQTGLSGGMAGNSGAAVDHGAHAHIQSQFNVMHQQTIMHHHPPPYPSQAADAAADYFQQQQLLRRQRHMNGEAEAASVEDEGDEPEVDPTGTEASDTHIYADVNMDMDVDIEAETEEVLSSRLQDFEGSSSEIKTLTQVASELQNGEAAQFMSPDGAKKVVEFPRWFEDNRKGDEKASVSASVPASAEGSEYNYTPPSTSTASAAGKSGSSIYPETVLDRDRLLSFQRGVPNAASLRTSPISQSSFLPPQASFPLHTHNSVTASTSSSTSASASRSASSVSFAATGNPPYHSLTMNSADMIGSGGSRGRSGGRGRTVGSDYWRSVASEQYLSIDPERLLTFKSITKMSLVVLVSVVMAYFSVVPRRGLTLTAYNLAFKQNLLRLASSAAWPLLLMLSMYSTKAVNINQVIGHFSFCFIVGYPLLAVLEFALATAVRLVVLRILEPGAFAMCPKVPAVVLPWALAQNGYLPSRITLLLFSFLNGCVMAPVLEEMFKFVMLQQAIQKYASAGAAAPLSASSLSHDQTSPTAEKPTRDGKTTTAAEATTRSTPPPMTITTARTNDFPLDTALTAVSPEAVWWGSIVPVTARTHMVYMTAIALGLKMADNTRRILLYTSNLPSSRDRYKTLFALARGVFPLQELCGAITALGVARSNILYRIAPYDRSSATTTAAAPANWDEDGDRNRDGGIHPGDIREKKDRDDDHGADLDMGASHVVLSTSSASGRDRAGFRPSAASTAAGASAGTYMGPYSGDREGVDALQTPGMSSQVGSRETKTKRRGKERKNSRPQQLQRPEIYRKGGNQIIRKALFSAIFLHAMANFRGMKPFFVWNSKRPWDELQLQMWNPEAASTPQKLVITSAMNMLWFMLVAKSVIDLVRQYVLLVKEHYHLMVTQSPLAFPDAQPHPYHSQEQQHLHQHQYQQQQYQHDQRLEAHYQRQ